MIRSHTSITQTGIEGVYKSILYLESRDTDRLGLTDFGQLSEIKTVDVLTRLDVSKPRGKICTCPHEFEQSGESSDTDNLQKTISSLKESVSRMKVGDKYFLN